MASVLVVVVAYNSGQHLQRCLDALAEQTFRDWTAVVWDNASGDGAIETLRLAEGMHLQRSLVNLGFAAANNLAATTQGSRWIACLNPDAFPEPGWLAALVETGERTGAAAVGSLQLRDADPKLLDGVGDVLSIGGVAWRGGYLRPRAEFALAEAEIFAPCAAAALYRRETWEQAGGFDERYFAFFEDVDLGFRLRLAGERAVFAPGAVVRHVGGGSGTGEGGFAERHGARNLVRTFAKNMPLMLWPIALPAHAVSLAVMLWIGWRRGTLRPRWEGFIEGWRGARPYLAENLRTPKRVSAILPFLVWNPLSLRARRPVFRPLV